MPTVTPVAIEPDQKLAPSNGDNLRAIGLASNFQEILANPIPDSGLS
jgi:hypothetical protein